MERLGHIESFGTQFRMLSLRGWVILDDRREVEEELEIIRSLNSSLPCSRREQSRHSSL